MGLGKGQMSQTAASGSEVWEGRSVGCGGRGVPFYFLICLFYFILFFIFLRIHCSMGREVFQAPCSTDLGSISRLQNHFIQQTLQKLLEEVRD